MPRIKVLPVDLRNKIAAGEVIERPASVVKELIENAIDAESTEIRVEILNGGKRLIRVSDNGIGMDREDALLCLEPHATSKLSTTDDLFNITTLGFRGEALASIASVSRIVLITGSRGSSAGVSIEVSGGEVREIKDSPSSGTSLEVRDLFFNTPARKKFLKANSTELFHILDTVTKEALSHFRIGFSLSADGRNTMLLPVASGLKERIMQVYGEDFMKGLIEAEAVYDDMSMKAFVSDSRNFRNNRDYQFLFINGRPIKDQSISHALYKAYEGILPADRHPVFFVFLEIDPVQVDFNVHPTKREVRFGDKETVYRFVNSNIRNSVREERAGYTSDFTAPPDSGPDNRPAVAYDSAPAASASFVAEERELKYRTSLPYIYLGDTFIGVSGKAGLTIIDHHAAHERILYEKFLGKTEIASHNLLFPEQVRLSHKEHRAIIENRDLLQEFGIEVDDFGHDAVVVRSLPEAISFADLRMILADIASSVLSGTSLNKSLKETLAAKLACHSSVRGKEVLNQEELSRLLEDLENTEHPDQCPHGRPTRIFYSLDDLKKLFKRK